jgi:hypothetical protein
MKLVNQKTKVELKIGDEVNNFRGEKVVIKKIWPPNTSQGGRTGKVELMAKPGLFNVITINAEFADD